MWKKLVFTFPQKKKNQNSEVYQNFFIYLHNSEINVRI